MAVDRGAGGTYTAAAAPRSFKSRVVPHPRRLRKKGNAKGRRRRQRYGKAPMEIEHLLDGPTALLDDSADRADPVGSPAIAASPDPTAFPAGPAPEAAKRK